jgi:uncharacterized protein
MYQALVSPLLPRACRFEPTCSEYYRQTLMIHGPLRATWLAVRRICRCNPWNPGGFDPPPARVQRDEERA